MFSAENSKAPGNQDSSPRQGRFADSSRRTEEEDPVTSGVVVDVNDPWRGESPGKERAEPAEQRVAFVTRTLLKAATDFPEVKPGRRDDATFIERERGV